MAVDHECRVCLQRQDWLMIGRRDAATRPFTFGTAHRPLRLDGQGRSALKEVLLVCENGHMISVQHHAQDPLPALLRGRAQEKGRVVTLWASTTGGKTVLVDRLLMCVAPQRSRHFEALPWAVSRVQDRIAERHLRIDPLVGTFELQNECRSVLIEYLQNGENGLSAADATNFLDEALKSAGVAAGIADEQDQRRELNRWGQGRQPYVPLYHFDGRRQGVRARWTARLWICDEPGEIHETQGILLKDPAEINPNSEALLWIVDAAATPDSIAGRLLDSGEVRLLTQSFRKALFKSPDRQPTVDQALDVAAEKWQFNSDILPRVHAQAARSGVEVAVILTKLDLVAAVLKQIENHPDDNDGRREEDPTYDKPALITLLGHRAPAAIELATRGLIGLADHWLDDSRVEAVAPSARAFLGRLGPAPEVAEERDRRLEHAATLAAAVLNHFGTSQAFWNLLQTEEAIRVPNPTDGGEGWSVDHLRDYYAMMLGHRGGVPIRFGLRDVVCSIVGSALLVLYEYSADQIELLGQRSPERYFLVSALSDFSPSPEKYIRQLRNSKLHPGGIKHLFYWLLSGFVEGDDR